MFYKDEELDALNKSCIALEQLNDCDYDVNRLISRMSEQRGTHRGIADQLEELVPGSVSKRVPLSTFTQSYSMTNYQIALEAAEGIHGGIKIAALGAIVGVIVGVVRWLMKYFTKASENDVKKKVEEAVKTAKNAENLCKDFSSALSKLDAAKRSAIANECYKRVMAKHATDGLVGDPDGRWIATAYKHMVGISIGTDYSEVTMSVLKSGDASNFSVFLAGSYSIIDKMITMLVKASETLVEIGKKPNDYKHIANAYTLDYTGIIAEFKRIGITLGVTKANDDDDIKQAFEDAKTAVKKMTENSITDKDPGKSMSDNTYKCDLKTEKFGAFAQRLTTVTNNLVAFKVTGTPDEMTNINELRNEVMQSVIGVTNFNTVCHMVSTEITTFYGKLVTATESANKTLDNFKAVVNMDTTLTVEEKAELTKVFK